MTEDENYLMYALTHLEPPDTWTIIPDDELPGYFALCAVLTPIGAASLGADSGSVVVASHGELEALMAIRAAFSAAYVNHSEVAWSFTGDVVELPEELA
jgi:hypothetical protein